MGNEKSKNCLSCSSDTVFVDCSPPSTGRKATWSDNNEVAKPKSKSELNMNKTLNTNGDSPLTSFSVSDASLFGLEDSDGVLAPKRPQLKNNSSSSENMSSQLSVLMEANADAETETEMGMEMEMEMEMVMETDNEATKWTSFRPKEFEYVDVPPMVADLIKPGNARKNVMDSFQVIQTLGDGMSSSVFEVQHVVTGHRYALKRLRRAQNHSDLLFVGECKFLNVLKCQGVIRIVDAFADENYFYVLNELGVSDLFKKIKASQRISEQIAKEIIRFLLETVRELHRNNMVHRDIKPENVVFTDKKSNFPKLIDFGDAIVVKDNSIYTELVGTQCYLAPERWRQHYGWELKAADIWAIGVLTFEMVTGKRCYYGSSEQELVRKIQKGHYKFPENLEPSSLCGHFIRSLLTVKSRHRPTAEFALKHPWLSECDDPQMQCSLIEAWNTNVTNVSEWTVYQPNFPKNIST